MKYDHILIVDDEEDILEELGDYLSSKNYKISTAKSFSEGEKIMKRMLPGILFLDIKMPDCNGLDALQKINKTYPQIQVIIMSAYGDMDSVVKAFRYGAVDYLEKPFNLKELDCTLNRLSIIAKEIEKIRANPKKLLKLSDERMEDKSYTIVGQSKLTMDMINMIENAATNDFVDVLITGESGTGKELVARAIQFFSRRKNKTYYDLNCSAIPEQLFESELFGHSKNAFTGANTDKIGAFEAANGGILVLDEISCLPLNMQAKLLRVLEEKKFRRVGENKLREVNTRVISITNENLNELCSQKKFRLDLYHRLNTFSIYVPPLRERRADIPLLVDYFIIQSANWTGYKVPKISKEVLGAFEKYHFPGNIRELNNMIRKALILSKDKKTTLELKDFPELNSFLIDGSFENRIDLKELNSGIDLQAKLDEIEKHWILQALIKCNYRVNKAAEILNITRFSLSRRMKKYNIEI